MATEQRYATLAARLESFEAAVPLPKRRGSNAKGSKFMTWPHQRPSSEELARAGFYYSPLPTSRDNTVCFLCERSLDGWEEDDDPVLEHLKHSEQCGWANIMAVGRHNFGASTMEDPTDTKLSEARRATFMSSWPHDGKRGWTCKTEKLVEAGWHFAPTPESEDFVSCAYCKLALDGWEPKDNPFDEHYRRSPDCPFFAFAGTTATKVKKGKKGRASKGSRHSTQSVLTAASEAPSIPDFDDSIDVSILSQDTVLSSASNMGNKKNGRGKAKAIRARKPEAVQVIVPPVPVDEYESHPETKSNKNNRGTKRASDQISEDGRGERESTVKPEPPSKKRDTRKRGTLSEEISYPALQPEEERVESESVPTMTVPEGRKRASSRIRSVSTISTAAGGVGVPDNASLEAALQFELDKPLSDDEIEPAVPEEPAKPRGGRTRANSKPTAQARPAGHEGEPATRVEGASETDPDASILSKSKGRPTRITKKAAGKKTVRGSAESATTFAALGDPQLESSMLTAPTAEDDSGHETDASLSSKAIVRKGSKRATANKSRTKNTGKRVVSKKIEDIVQQQSQRRPATVSPAPAEPELETTPIDNMEKIVITEAEPISETAEAIILENAKAPKKATKSTKTKTGKQSKAGKARDKAPQLSMPGAFSPLMPDKDPEPSFNSVLIPTSPTIITKRADPHVTSSAMRSLDMPVLPAEKEVSPTPLPTPRNAANTILAGQQSVQKGKQPQRDTTPSLSPQSSDAENAPPSSRPASTRPPLAPLSPLKTQILRIPTQFGTPKRVPLSPSKVGGGLKSDVPWTGVYVEMIFTQPETYPEQENLFPSEISGGVAAAGRLTSPEKKMSVEEWIYWHAKTAEQSLRAESERVVGIFEKEGARAARVLEGIEVIE